MNVLKVKRLKGSVSYLNSANGNSTFTSNMEGLFKNEEFLEDLKIGSVS